MIIRWRVCCVVFFVSVGVVRAENEPRKREIYPRHILIIRHGEKTADKTDIHLSKTGIQRASELHRLFESSKDRPDPFPAPSFIFAASNSPSSHRPVETVMPLAKSLKFSIDQSFDSKRTLSSEKKEAKIVVEGMVGLRDEIFGKPKYAGKTILVAWRHGSIPDLVKALGVKDAPAKWEDNCFDRVWHISYDERGNATFRNRPQRLLPGDSQK